MENTWVLVFLLLFLGGGFLFCWFGGGGVLFCCFLRRLWGFCGVVCGSFVGLFAFVCFLRSGAF